MRANNIGDMFMSIVSFSFPLSSLRFSSTRLRCPLENVNSDFTRIRDIPGEILEPEGSRLAILSRGSHIASREVTLNVGGV